MDYSKLFSGQIAAETLEQTNIATIADVGGASAGKSCQFSAVNKDGIEKTFQPYMKPNGVGDDPTLGKKESDVITNREDVAGDLGSKYFIIHDGISTLETDYYVYYTIAGVGYDPKLGVQEQHRAVTISDVFGNLDGTYYKIHDAADIAYHVWYAVDGFYNTDPAVGRVEISKAVTIAGTTLGGKYFLIKNGANAPYYVWYNTGASGDPVPGGTGIEVAIGAGDTSTQVATKTKNAINTAPFSTHFSATSSTNNLYITNLAVGNCTDIGVGDSGFTVSVTQQGVTLIAAIGDGIKVKISSNSTAAIVAIKTINEINLSRPSKFLATIGGTSATVNILNAEGGASTNAADGTYATGFTITTPIAGVAKVVGLATYTLLASISVANGATNVQVATATAAALNAIPGWVCAQQANPNDMKVTLTHKTKGNCANTVDGNIGGVWVVAVTTGTDPTPAIKSVLIAYANGASANDVAAAIRAALVLGGFPKLVKISGGTNNCLIENRWAAAVTNGVDIDSGFTVTTPVAGTATIEPQMARDLATATYVYKPDLDEVIYMDEIGISLNDSACSDGTLFGAIAALTNGILIKITDKDGNLIKLLKPAIKNNSQVSLLGRVGPPFTNYITVTIDYSGYGGIPINGANQEMLQVVVPDNIKPGGVGVDSLLMNIEGHYFDLSRLRD